MPDDAPFDYLPTQAIADFLATSEHPAIDGILYPSVQRKEGKLNVVLFHKAARVQPLDIPKGTVISASLDYDTEDGPEIDYRVSEMVPPEESSVVEGNKDFPVDGRALTLRLDVSSLTVHHVDAVEFKTEPYSVHRNRSEKREWKF